MIRSPGDSRKISAAIRSSGVPYVDIARKIGVSYHSVAAYASQTRSPSAGTLPKLARALGVDVRTLLSDETRELFGAL